MMPNDNSSQGVCSSWATWQQTQRGSGYGNDKQVKPARDSPPVPDMNPPPEFVCEVEDVDGGSGEMGNAESFCRQKRVSIKAHEVDALKPNIPEISVTEAGSIFTLPGPVQTGSAVQEGTIKAELSSTEIQSGLRELEQIPVVRRRGFDCREPMDNVEDEGRFDSLNLSGRDGNTTPKGSREHFIQVMMSSSPQVRSSMVLRRSFNQSFKSDSDSFSVVSSNPEEDRTLVTLDPMEHEWMMCASDGEWVSLHRLLATDPGLVLRKDFVTGFTCLHWAAKHCKPELFELIINFAKQHNIPISVDVRSNNGYTPLHIAAMHDHMEVVKLLVGTYNANVEVRDYSGRKACQYFSDNVSMDMLDIIGAYEQTKSKNSECRDKDRWRVSKVVQSNLNPLIVLNPSHSDSVYTEDSHRDKPVRRKSSFSRMKPTLQRLRMRASQIFQDMENLDGSADGSFKSRPKTHFFG